MIHAVAYLIIAAFVLLPFGRTIEIPLGILALIGIYQCVRGQVDFRAPAIKLLLMLYAAIVIPMVLSLPDAIAFKRSLTTTIGSVRYLFAGIILLNFVNHPRAGQLIERVLMAGAIVVTFWAADALLQTMTGSNILGYEVTRGYINGVFGEDDNLKLPLAMVLFYPFALVWTQRHLSMWQSALIILLILLALLFTGKRVALLAVAVQTALLAMFYLRAKAWSLPAIMAGLCLALLVAGSAYLSSDWVKERTDNVAIALTNPSYDTINTALSLRLPIWEAAVKIGSDHWLNGVGPRGFRYIYADYAPTNNLFANTIESDLLASGVSHPHQILLEIGTETGVIGLLGLCALYLLLWQIWCKTAFPQRAQALPFIISALGILFPLNSQGAFYSSWCAQLMWLMLALTIFALYARPFEKLDSRP